MSIFHTQIQITQWTWNAKNLTKSLILPLKLRTFIYHLFVFLNNAE